MRKKITTSLDDMNSNKAFGMFYGIQIVDWRSIAVLIQIRNNAYYDERLNKRAKNEKPGQT